MKYKIKYRNTLDTTTVEAAYFKLEDSYIVFYNERNEPVYAETLFYIYKIEKTDD